MLLLNVKLMRTGGLARLGDSNAGLGRERNVTITGGEWGVGRHSANDVLDLLLACQLIPL